MRALFNGEGGAREASSGAEPGPTTQIRWTDMGKTMRTHARTLSLTLAGIGLFTAGAVFGPGLTRPATAVASQPEGEMRMSPEQMKVMQAWEKAGTPGKMHKHLDKLAGEWTGEFNFWMDPEGEPITYKGDVTREWVLNGHFLKEHVSATSAFGPFEGIGMMGYNNMDQMYEVSWFDSHSTATMSERGRYLPADQSFFFYGEKRDPVTGATIVGWSELDVSDPDTHTFEGYEIDPGGNEIRRMTGKMTRVQD